MKDQHLKDIPHIAYVHDRIVHEGGAESYLRSLIEQHKTGHHRLSEHRIFVFYSNKEYFADIPITTAMPRRLNNRFIRCNTSKPFFLTILFDYRNLMFWFPLLCWLLRKKIMKYKPTHTHISSFAAAKNIVPIIHTKQEHHGSHMKESPQHSLYNDINKIHTSHKPLGSTSLYLHSPMQYIWENYEENIKKIGFPIKQFYRLATQFLRPRDKSPRQYDTIMMNSEYTQSIATQLYGWEPTQSHIVYPPVHSCFHDVDVIIQPRNYMLFIGRVQRYVREIDRIIIWANTYNIPLLIMGDGPDMEYAQSLAGPGIIFLGQITDQAEKKEILRYAFGVINIAKESFGIATAEALCCGVPVLGYTQGATPYLVEDGIDGIIVSDKTPETLQAGYEIFCMKNFDRETIAYRAQKRFYAK